jgi:predicted Fe-Mo cluster-binding NifX family protein
MQPIKLAVPTEGTKGLHDVVSQVFGRAKTFTIVTVSEGSIDDVHVVENPAATYKQGAGPIVVKTMVEMEVNMIAAKEVGPGASVLLEHHRIQTHIVDAGISVTDAIEHVLKQQHEHP